MNYQGSTKTGRSFNAYTVRTSTGYAAVVTVRHGNTEKSLHRQEMANRQQAYRQAQKIGKALAANDAYLN